jgi:hypothetical protein
VPTGADDRVLDGSDRPTVTELRFLASVERLELAVVGSNRWHRTVLECVIEPLAALAGMAGAAFAGGLVVARTLTGPRGEMASGREYAHVDTNLGNDVLRRSFLDTRDRAQQLNRCSKRGELLLDRVREPVDLLAQEIQVGEDRAD